MGKPRPPDPLGPHLRVYHTLLNCPAYRVLGHAAKALFYDLRAKVRQTNNGDISATFSDLRHHGWKSKATLNDALFELVQLGFIEQTRQGGIASMSKICSLYRFTDLDTWELPKHGIPASKRTDDYLKFETVGHAEAALRNAKAERAAKRSAARESKANRVNGKKSKVQKPYFKGTETVPMTPSKGTETVLVRVQ